MSIQADTAQSLVDAVFELGRALRTLVANDSETLLPQALTSVLFVLAGRGQCRQNELATELFVTQSSLSRQISCLVGAGYVTRDPDPDDGRAFLVSVSPTGAKMLRQTTQQRAARLRNLLQDWNQSDALAALASLGHLNESFAASNHRNFTAPGITSIGS